MRDKLHLLFYFLRKDIKGRYAGSALGLLWTVFIPLIQIVLFWFVFSAIMKARPYANTQIPYIYFLLSSFFFWLAFSEGIFRASHVIIENAEAVKKISFPNILLPITVTVSSYLLNMMGVLLFISVYSFITAISPVILFVIPVLFLQFLFSLGIGLFLAAVVPYFRDLGQILSHVMQGIFFITPIIYSIESIPERFRIIFYCNPLTYFVSSYHHIILLSEVPPLHYLIIILILSILSFLFGLYIFRKLRDGFADVL